ncbi:hypothetical protein EEB11_12430 [Pseudotabrizicola sediminis]|uniref:Uncharacterized protein n=1 Tax=Pseudotabrizicola sediminis TaxID=2486418 RepID=A0ABY2KJF8_9RHOB|nr:hypothetical protein EEB11_12430 [Pseudotabrizicola sediminis]
MPFCAQDLVRVVGFDHFDNLADREPAGRDFDQQIARIACRAIFVLRRSTTSKQLLPSTIRETMHSFGVFIQFRAARPAPDQHDLGHLIHRPLCHQTVALAFFRRNAGAEQHAEGQCALA